MRILIDADACPVIDITVKIAKKYEIQVIMITDINHQIESEYGQVINIDQGQQSVDMKIFNSCQENDIIITQDYGLAALVLSKNAQAINQNGFIYTDNNIDNLLYRRHLNAKIRRAGGKHPTQKKRSDENDQKVAYNLEILIKDTLPGINN